MSNFMMLVVSGAVAAVSYGVSPLLIDHPQAVDSQTDWEFSVAPYPLTAGYRAAGPDP
ncbi:hypothetical protein [Sinorhizobium medicae]|nr:hypothetical protein [Sinorhizobium medicae]MDX0961102.1 hypothetical protein [Sinorhizobium medicae]TWA35015.1 hypothetical protein FB009_11464 [Sinorhizobium medicae]